MRDIENAIPMIRRFGIGGLLLTALLTVGSKPAFSQKAEVIEASSRGTGTQMGEVIEIRLSIYDYSTLEDRQVLVDAFNKGQNQGLVNALSKMKAVGHISITGTLGYDVSYIKLTQTPTGRNIRFVTNRQIRLAEGWADSTTQAFNLSAGELNLNDTDKSKSSGVFYPAAMLVLDPQKQLKIDLTQNAWQLSDVLDWKGTPGVN